VLEQYPIADLMTWLDEKTLILNAEFQRRAIWPPAAKTYLIDTIIRDKPIPSIYMRTGIDPRTRRAFREVVDGQQRLRTIHEFVNGEWELGSRAEEFRGNRFVDLDEDMQQAFLSYRIGVVQLFNASNVDVLDVFNRLNSFSYTLNSQELRHGKYQGEFREAVRQASSHWSSRLWDKYNIVSLRARVRMGDDELMAQMFGVILEGVVNGGQPSIERLYRKYDREVPKQTAAAVDTTITYILENFSEVLETTGLVRGPHFLMLFAAVAYALLGIPKGDMELEMPLRDPRALTDLQMAKSNLGLLGEVLEAEEEDVQARLPRFAAFKMASGGSTHRIRSRKIRFPTLYRALLPDPI
jgi:hypothetical protein